jgi:hypothetical protein
MASSGSGGRASALPSPSFQRRGKRGAGGLDDVLDEYFVRLSLLLLFKTPPLTAVTSTPFGTLHWYLKKFRPTYPRAIALAHVAYLATYGLCRVHLLYWILHVYGLWVDRSALAALASLPWSCQLGIGLIGTTNTLWLLMGMRKVIKQYAP